MNQLLDAGHTVTLLAR
ncbi:hypothetical protein, partial [Burkholderia cenocepacia]